MRYRSIFLIFLAAPLSVLGQSIHYEVPAKSWPTALGSHRAIVKVTEPAPAVHVHLEWRRRDSAPERKGIVVSSLSNGDRVENALATSMAAEAGDIVFEAKSAGEYAVYFLPGDPGHGSFPEAKYLPPAEPKDPAWKLTATSGKLPDAPVVRWEARTEHDRFTDVEIIATTAECDAWKASHAALPFAVFPEIRDRAARMFDHIPELWLKRTADPDFAVRINEYYPFQLVLWAARKPLKNVTVTFSAFRGDSGTIPAAAFSCLQTAGINWDGQPITHRLDVAAGQVLPLWCALDLDSSAKPGRYVGTAEIHAEDCPLQRIELSFTVAGPALADRGDSEPARLTKLRWLNSTIGLDDESTQGFPALNVRSRSIRLLGRAVTLGANGLPERITSYFHPGVTKVVDRPTEILAAPMRFVVELADGTSLPLAPADFTVKKSDHGGNAEWAVISKSGAISLDLHGRIEFDGHVEYRCTLHASDRVDVRDIRLEVPRTPATTSLILGLGNYGGAAPAALDWKWDVEKKHQDAVWLGCVNAGLRVQLRAENYVRPYVNIHYVRQPLNDPPSWGNSGKGGIRFSRGDKDAVLTCFSGARTLEPAQPLHFDFDLSITPFRVLNTEAQWRDRYYHISGVTEPGKIRETGANVVNIHQGNALNPYINYPFLTADKLAAYADKVHAAEMRVKYYYTVRELTNWTPELFAARSFGSELIARGKGHGHAWCEEHLGGEYWQAWAEPSTNDASILTASLSRWNNLYLQGLDWLIKNAGCDGLYLDDISYDRTVMLRARKILDRSPELTARGGGLIDLHSWNESRDARAGYASCALAFMDSFPFVDRLWFGEGHPYDGPAEQTLTAISGIPFGMMGEMLQGGGNPWLGLTFGMTGRYGWGGAPQEVWKLWSQFGVEGSEFIGWWDPTGPVQTSTPEVKATVWKKAGRTLLALGNFGDKPVRAELAIDWKVLGLNSQKTALYAPALNKLQPEALFHPGDKIPLAPKRGLVLWLDETPRRAPASLDTLALSTRPVIFEDRFVPRASPDWQSTVSEKAKDALKLDGQGQVFLAPANAHAWLSRPLPSDTKVVAAQLRQDEGDSANSWGPGLAVVWPNGRFLKVNRRADGRFGLSVDGQERLAGQVDRELPVIVAISLEEKEVRLLALGEGAFQQEQELAHFPRDEYLGSPAEVRVGKMPNSLKPQDNAAPGEMGWSRCDWIRVLGAAQK